MSTDITRWTDWRINTERPQDSIVFPGPLRVEGKELEHARILAERIAIKEKEGAQKGTFVLEFEGYRYRIDCVKPSVYAVRMLRQKPWRLQELGFLNDQVNLLLSDDLQKTGGLVIIFGTTGSGKTTTLAGTLVSRLEKFGGYCLCVEDPPENVMEGFHGKGYLEQIDASGIGYEAALVDALRCFPTGSSSMMMLGEIRSRQEAYELTQIALDGHLVFTTMHSKDIISGLSRLVSLAGANGETAVRSMLANGLLMAVHLRMVGPRPKMTALRFNQTTSAIIKNGELHRLQDEILLQNKLLT